MISKQDYINPQKFPLTTVSDLSYEEQKMIDSMNWDQLVYAIETGRSKVTPRKVAILKELSIKLNFPLPKELTQSS